MPALTHDQLLEVQQAALRARLEDQRATLLATIDRRLVAQLPRVPRPDAQLLEDLDYLNGVGALGDGTYPLEIWLKNAVTLTEPRPEATLFLSHLTAIDRSELSHTLVVRGGSRDGTRLYLREGTEHILGRGRRATLQFREDLRISGVHARLGVRDRVLHVKDLGSRHGVFLNERRVEESPLVAGDVLRCGRTVLLVEDGKTPITVFSDKRSSQRATPDLSCGTDAPMCGHMCGPTTAHCQSSLPPTSGRAIPCLSINL